MNRLVLALLLVGCVKSRVDEQDAGATSSAITARPATTAAGLSVDQCEKILVGAEKKLSEARAAAATECKTKDDCTLVYDAACIGSCPVHPIAKSAQAAYERTFEGLRTTSCKEWNEGGCPKTTPKPTPTCRAFPVACTNGKCVRGE